MGDSIFYSFTGLMGDSIFYSFTFVGDSIFYSFTFILGYTSYGPASATNGGSDIIIYYAVIFFFFDCSYINADFVKPSLGSYFSSDTLVCETIDVVDLAVGLPLFHSYTSMIYSSNNSVILIIYCSDGFFEIFTCDSFIISVGSFIISDC